jgi:tRNA G10  N-methylase Trm11
MVRLAGAPNGVVLLDPCCGSGTILAEALAAGWRAQGGDLDPAAVAVARRNVPTAQLSTADARRIAVPDGSIGACVSNLPFGRQFTVQAGRSWLVNVLGELSRVTRRGGRVVLLAPAIPRAAMPARLRLDQRIPIRLLGTPASIWSFTRLG